MNQHAGPACALSILIVGLFAVLLHDRNPPTTPKNPIAQDRSASVPDRSVSPTTDVATPPHRETQLAASLATPPEKTREEQPKAQPTGPPKPINSEPSLVAKPVTDSPPVPPRQAISREQDARALQPRTPRTPFTVVLPGETLSDIAARVYGSVDSTEELWRANRDQLARIDSVLVRGTLLRTP